MGVYISGLEMPQDGRITLQIDSNGGVYVVNKFSITSEKYEKSMPAIGIQPHGNLKDESDITSLIEVMFCNDKDGMEHAIQCVKDAPTVIEAEGSE